MNMKKLIACAALVAALAFTPMSYAEAEAESSGSTPAVQEAMKGVKSFNRKINKKAKYYIYLQSASWCGPCNQEMPELAKMYPKMKKAGIELILVSADRDEKTAKAFLKKYKAGFPGVMPDAAKDFPGFQRANGIPNAIIVTADGEVLQTGHGSIIKQWKEICKPTDDK